MLFRSVAVIVAAPLEIHVTVPLSDTVATEALLLLHSNNTYVALSGYSVAVMFAVDPPT